MFKLNWKLSSVVQAQLKSLVRAPKAATVGSAIHSSPKRPGAGEGLGADLTIGEQKLITKLKREFPKATHVEVSDVSGGCGAMYQISIETPEFIGKRRIQQHQMVNKVLEEEIKQMHGLQLNTKEPSAK